MKVIDDISNIGEDLAIIVGNFDGVHLGHQSILRKSKDACGDELSLLVLSFSPHPKIYFKDISESFLISSEREKQVELEKKGVDYYFLQKFDDEFSGLTAKQFLQRFVLENKNVKKIYLGHDFHFGKGREGDFSFSKKLLESRGVDVVSLGKWGEGVSSTDIRNHIQEGDVEGVSLKLGRRFSLNGTIRAGEKRGRTIGFPTANLSWDHFRILPRIGVYLTEIKVTGLGSFNSITNIGFNPTFGGAGKHVETYILDFDEEIYGVEVTLSFIERVREEMKFEGVKELVIQLKSDVEKARKYFEKI